MINRIARTLDDAIKGKNPSENKRSSKWESVRRDHLNLNSTCALCGGTESLEVHHIKPFHLHPELELDPNNLIIKSRKTPAFRHVGYKAIPIIIK